MTREPHPIEAIYVQAAGNGVEGELLEEVAAALRRTFQTPCVVREGSISLEFARDGARGQYYSTAILQCLDSLAAGPRGTRLIGITESDLFVPVLTFVFGEAQLEGRCAIVSLHRLREEFYGLPARPDLLRERAVKEAVHELGHTFGLRHCSDWRCVMASTHSVERLDLKTAEFCPACHRVVSAWRPVA